MQLTSSLLLCLSLALASGTSAAQDTVNHDAHHPASATVDTPKPAAADPATKMDMQMKAMHEMHQKIMAAKTPEERKLLMAEHMKTMRESMSMMQDMTGATGGKKDMSQQAMKKQMGMMTMMMQMMMDEMEMAHHATSK